MEINSNEYLVLSYLLTIFGLLLFLITLIVQNQQSFYIRYLLVFIVPFLQPFLGLIPEWGDNIQKSLKYIPFSYLTEKSSSGSIKFTNWHGSFLLHLLLFYLSLMYFMLLNETFKLITFNKTGDDTFNFCRQFYLH